MNVTLVDGGERALEQLEALHPDILLPDLLMPDLDGLAFLRQAHALDLDLIIIILMTGCSGVQSAAEAVRQWAEDYLMKPMVMAELTILLDRAIERSALRRRTLGLRTRLQGRHPRGRDDRRAKDDRRAQPARRTSRRTTADEPLLLLPRVSSLSPRGEARHAARSVARARRSRGELREGIG